MSVTGQDQCPQCQAARKDHTLSRRQFFNALGWGSFTALVAGLAGAGARYLVPNRVGPSRNAFAAGKVKDFRQKVTYINGRRAFIVKNEQGLRALSAVCTHLGCTVKWVPENDRLECPCHGSLFDPMTGRVLGGPAPRPLDWYRLSLSQDGELIVDPDDIVGENVYLTV